MNIQGKFKINFVLKDLKAENIRLGYQQFNEAHAVNGKLYALVSDTLFEIDVFTFTEIARIPDIRGGGYGRFCVFNN